LKFLRSLTGTALSIWLGFLACVLGCAQPTVAAELCPTARQTSLRSSPFANPVDNYGGTCCHHQRGSSKNSGDKQQSSVSCCPLDATVIQKQSLSSPSPVSVHIAITALPVFDRSAYSLSTDRIGQPPLWQSGRDVLLQVRVLRI
jgi:hypothetical protein